MRMFQRVYFRCGRQLYWIEPCPRHSTEIDFMTEQIYFCLEFQ